MSDDDILNRLLRRRSQLRQRIRVLSDPTLNAESARTTSVLVGDQAEEQRVLDALGLTPRDELMQIDAALLQLRLGSFGRCEICNRAIDPVRLQLSPYVRRCERCASGGGNPP